MKRGRSVTVTGDRYRAMINEFLLPQLDRMDLEDMWFQQDGASSHTAAQTIELLRSHFPGRLISKEGDVNWPPRSCDLTPLDFFLWGYVKDRVYVNNPQTIDALKVEIERVIGEIEPHLCRHVIENLGKRFVVCKRSRGGHLADIVFHV